MPVSFTDAVAAYSRATGAAPGGGLAARDQATGPDFASVLRDAAESTIESLKKSDAETLKAAAGKADINEVVMAVSQADLTLQTMVAVRDRVIQAYQEILRMPI